MSVVVVVVVVVVSVVGAGGGGGGVVVVVVVVVVSVVDASSWLPPHEDKPATATNAPSTIKLRSLMAITSVNKLRKTPLFPRYSQSAIPWEK